jgi:hypothetical protein
MSNHHSIVITDPRTVTIVTGAYAIVIDKKTGKVKKVVWEKIPPGGWIAALEGGAALLRGTEGLQGAEELRLDAAKFLVSLVETVATEVAAKAASPEAFKPGPDPWRGNVFVITDPEALKPSPDPWRGNVFAIADPGTVTVVTEGFGLVIDRKTGKIKQAVPEMVIPGEYGYTVAAAVVILRNTEGLKGVEELRLQTAKFLTSMTETVAAEVATKSA